MRKLSETFYFLKDNKKTLYLNVQYKDTEVAYLMPIVLKSESLIYGKDQYLSQIGAGLQKVFL